MDKNKQKVEQRHRRHVRVRKTLEGTPERPRLSVFRSHKHIYAQVIDDWNQCTLASASTQSPEVREQVARGGTVAGAIGVGTLIGKRCLERDIKAVVFDRGGYRYHGRIKALADAARKQFKDAGAPGF